MTLWIVTTGSSDVQLKTGDNLEDLYNRIDSNKYEVLKDYNFKYPVEDENTGLYPVDSRILGWVYSHYLKDYGKDLDFPILESLMPMILEECSKNNSDSTLKILVLLTDQSKIFDESDSNEIGLANCPYWQDTCTLEPIFEWYFQKELQIKPDFCLIQPINSQERKGIDHWNEMLTVVKEKLDNSCETLNLEPDEVVYVSHQAGTPAISSAVQFVSIGKFKTVKFLVSNLFYNPEAGEKIEERQYKPEVIDSSTYWRSLQVQKAKELMIKGFPGSALELIRGLVDQSIIDQLETWVNIFNIKATVDNKKDEFKPKNAIERVRDALDLIEIFFKQENYLQGITLLSAAQETFLKAAVMDYLSNVGQIRTVEEIEYPFPPIEILTWTNQGLLFLDDQQHDSTLWRTNQNQMASLLQNRNRDIVKQRKIEILEYLKFPVNESIGKLDLWNKFNQGKLQNLKCTNDNNALLLWLKAIDPTIQTWSLLDWIGKYQRKFEDDRRNQLMHNLRGVEKKDVMLYLYGYTKSEEDIDDSKDDSKEVHQVYQDEVKKPFINALHSLRLLDDNLEVNSIEQDLKDLANRL